MIPYKWPVATAIPQNSQVRREIVKAAQTLLEDGDERLRQRRAELASIREDLAKLARDIAAFQRHASALISSELRKYGYNPEEPRVPKHNDGGGQWTRAAGADDSQMLSDTTPDTLVPGARYAANDTNDNLTSEQACQQAYADGITSIRRDPSLSPEDYLKARYQLASALELCLRLASGSRPISRDGNFVEFFGAGVVIFKPGQATRYVRWSSSND